MSCGKGARTGRPVGVVAPDRDPDPDPVGVVDAGSARVVLKEDFRRDGDDSAVVVIVMVGVRPEFEPGLEPDEESRPGSGFRLTSCPT